MTPDQAPLCKPLECSDCNCAVPADVYAVLMRAERADLGEAAARDHLQRTNLALLADENTRLTACLKAANDQAEHFERLWYLAKEDADRYAFAKTLEGQKVTIETFKNRGAAELDQALEDAMAEDADARNEAGYGA